MSTYQQRYQQLTDLHAAADPLLGTDRERWRDARRTAALTVLLDAAGHQVPDPSAVAALLDQIDAHLRDTLVWLAHTADTDAVAGVAALLDHARST